MAGNRPTHAATVRPVIVELPLWIAWCVTRMCRLMRVQASSFVQVHLSVCTPAEQLQLAGQLLIAACLLDVVALLSGAVS